MIKERLLILLMPPILQDEFCVHSHLRRSIWLWDRWQMMILTLLVVLTFAKGFRR